MVAPMGCEYDGYYYHTVLMAGVTFAPHRGPGACRTGALVYGALSPCTTSESVVVAPLGCEYDVIILSYCYDDGGYSCPANVALCVQR